MFVYVTKSFGNFKWRLLQIIVQMKMFQDSKTDYDSLNRKLKQQIMHMNYK